VLCNQKHSRFKIIFCFSIIKSPEYNRLKWVNNEKSICSEYILGNSQWGKDRLKLSKPNANLEKRKPRVVPGSEFKADIHEGKRFGLFSETFGCYFKLEAFKIMVNHCQEFARDKLEVMGFLLGDIYYRKNEIKSDLNLYSDITRVVSCWDLDASHEAVKFTDTSYEIIFEQLGDLNDKNIDYKILGWYHSHPGRGCFLSEIDLRTIKRNFNRPYNISIVIDPVSNKIKMYKLKESSVVKVRWLLYID
jgi:COP9 signalosome complex subunit 5